MWELMSLENGLHIGQHEGELGMHTVKKEFSYNGAWSVVFIAGNGNTHEVKPFNDFDEAVAFAHYMNGGDPS